jgi:hypothetical protein
MNAAALPGPADVNLNESYVFGLQALRPFLYLEGYTRALVERTVSASRNRREMDENIVPTLALNESKSLCGVEPLYGPSFFQNDSFCDLTPDVSIESGTAVGIKDSKAGPAEFKGCTRRITPFSLAPPGQGGSSRLISFSGDAPQPRTTRLKKLPILKRILSVVPAACKRAGERQSPRGALPIEFIELSRVSRLMVQTWRANCYMGIESTFPIRGVFGALPCAFAVVGNPDTVESCSNSISYLH